jgi:hypothetical protein
MAEPYFMHGGELLTDIIPAYSYWNMPWGKVTHTPLSGGAYPQNTMAGTLRIAATLGFKADHPTAPLDNYFRIFELERESAQTVYQFRDLQGWIRNVHIAQSPFGDVGEGAGEAVDLRIAEILQTDYLQLPLQLIVPGYLPSTLGAGA